jgi:exopolysaccharide biosynthesis polyprenyl glycosylphosphotransferase
MTQLTPTLWSPAHNRRDGMPPRPPCPQPCPESEEANPSAATQGVELSLVSPRVQRRIGLAVLLLTDLLMVGLAFLIAFGLRFRLGLPIFDLDIAPSRVFYGQLALILTALWLAVFAIFRLYDWNIILGGIDEYARLANSCTAATVLVIAIGFIWPNFIVARGWLLSAWLLTFLCTASARFTLRRVVYALRRRGYFISNAIIVGLNEEAHALAEQLAAWQTSGLHVLGFVGDGATALLDRAPGPILGSLAELPELIESRQVSEIIVAQSAVPPTQLIEIMQRYGHSQQAHVHLSSGLFGVLTTGLRVRSLGYVPLIDVDPLRLSRLEVCLKWILDYFGALCGLLLLSPVLMAIAIAVRLDSPGPIVYRRRVLGCRGRVFDAYKFRTMRVDGDAILTPAQQAELRANYKLKDDPRITRIGRVLRKYSLDELPQLANVLKGQMSLIGPRMITPTESEKYGKWATNLLTVKPGLSGLWQVSGRSDIGYDERVQMDMYYIRNYTIWLDIQLIIQTVLTVTSGRGAY